MGPYGVRHGKAANAPNLRDTSSAEVTAHALEKLRERLPMGSHFLAMPDADLRLRLEDAWKEARRAKSVEEWWERVDSNLLCNFVVDLSDAFEVDLVGLFRENDRRHGQPVLITVLERRMAETNKATNKWARDPQKVGSKELLGSTMREKLRSMEVVKPVSAAPTLEPTAPPAEETCALTWLEPAEGKPAFRLHRLPLHHVSEFVSGLVEAGIELDSIELWAKREMKVKCVVTVSF